MSIILSIDFGGTRTRVGAFEVTDYGPKLVRRTEMLSQVSDTVQQVTDRIVALARTIVEPDDVNAIGIAAPGPLDPARGTILHARTLPQWENARIGDLIGRHFRNANRFVENDANLAALAEYKLGAGKDCDPLVYLTISTGIGGGLVMRGRLFHGWSGLASEPGHQLFTLSDGSVRRLEDLASGTALGRAARERLSATSVDSALRALELSSVDGKAVGQAAAAGDNLALEIVRTAGRWLGMGLLNLIHILSPQRIILGGSVSLLGDLLLQPARDVIDEYVLDKRFIPESLIMPAALGDDVCLYGAAHYVWDRVLNPS